MSKNIIEFKDLSIEYVLSKYSLRAVNKVSLNLVEGKITALVGESGSGKTTIASSMINCISSPGKIVEGQVLYYGNDEVIDVAKLNEDEINKFRWKEISMVFQGAQSSLNPVITIFNQFYETLTVHENYKPKKERRKITKQMAKERVKYLLEFVNLDAERVMNSYPHELSGGMKQRVMIAFSLLLDPKVIILDEPTTALDVITQDFIFKLLLKIKREMNITMILFTHDIAVVAKYADYMGVMYGGELMEYGTVESVFKNRYHPYTSGLISSTPSLIADNSKLSPIDGMPPNLLNMPTGCRFHPRCKKCMEICQSNEPSEVINKNGHMVRCFLFDKEEKINE